jgi:hypothetical protein
MRGDVDSDSGHLRMIATDGVRGGQILDMYFEGGTKWHF